MLIQGRLYKDEDDDTTNTPFLIEGFVLIETILYIYIDIITIMLIVLFMTLYIYIKLHIVT